MICNGCGNKFLTHQPRELATYLFGAHVIPNLGRLCMSCLDRSIPATPAYEVGMIK